MQYVIIDQNGLVYGISEDPNAMSVAGKELLALEIPEGYTWEQCTLTQVDGTWTLIV